MCLSIAMERPECILEKGEHLGYEYFVVHNTRGYRCGYVKVTPGHPWHGRGYDDIDCSVHGGLTFAEPDQPCAVGQREGGDDGYWVGFDCMHAWDAIDPNLPLIEEAKALLEITRSVEREMEVELGPIHFSQRSFIRTTEYVVAECKSLCEQATQAARQ